MAMWYRSPTSTSVARDPCPQIPPGAIALLQDLATASQSQWDPAHGGIRHAMRGIPRDLPPLQLMEAFLCHQPLEEEGEGQQAGAAHADGVH